jgi:hypothetical protein
MQYREKLVHEEPMFTANAVPGPRDRPVACSEIRRLRRQRMIFGVRFKRRDYFPAFQFRNGMPKPIVGRALSPDDKSALSASQIAKRWKVSHRSSISFCNCAN